MPPGLHETPPSFSRRGDPSGERPEDDWTRGGVAGERRRRLRVKRLVGLLHGERVPRGQKRPRPRREPPAVSQRQPEGADGEDGLVPRPIAASVSTSRSRSPGSEMTREAEREAAPLPSWTRRSLSRQRPSVTILNSSDVIAFGPRVFQSVSDPSPLFYTLLGLHLKGLETAGPPPRPARVRENASSANVGFERGVPLAAGSPSPLKSV